LTALHECVRMKLRKMEDPDDRINHRKYFYLTYIRDPVQRFISEWKHVQRNATWKRDEKYRLKCNREWHELEDCYEGEFWTNVPFDEFISCSNNLAFNRQTRMLADLTKIQCYDKLRDKQDNFVALEAASARAMLDSAKENLSKIDFFGILEHQRDSQRLFEATFQLKFVIPFEQKTGTRASKVELTDKQLERIRAMNSLDIELYEYAQQLFEERKLKFKL